jgi:hypothetical protein
VLTVWGLARLARSWGREGFRDGPDTLLGVMAVVPLVFFTAAVTRATYADPHWGVLSAVCLLVWVAKDLADLYQTRPRWTVGLFAGALAFNAAVLALVFVHTYKPFLPVVEAFDPTRQIVGWREAAAETEALLRRDGLANPEYVVSFYYDLSSQFALHLPSQPLPYSFSREARNLWADPARIRGDNTVVVCVPRDCPWVQERLQARFGWKSLRELGTVRPVVWGTPRMPVVVMRKAD